MRRFLHFAFVLAAWFAFAQSANAQKANDWVGREVLPKAADVKLHVGKREFAWPGGKPRLKVERVQGEWLWLGEGWAAAGDVVSLADAEAFYTAEIQRQPTAFAYAHRAYARGRNELPGKLEDAEEAIKLDARDSLAYYCRAIAHFDENHMREGLSDLEKTIELEPSFGAAYRNRGSVLAGLHERDPDLADLDAALADLDHAIRLDPNDATAFMNRGWTWHLKGDLDRGIQDLSEAIRLNPTDELALINRARLFGKQGRYDQALADLDAVIRINPDDYTAYNNRSIVWLNQGDYEKAGEDAEHAIRLEPNDAMPYFNRGRSFYYRDDYEAAERDLSKAIELDRRHAASWRWRGRTRAMRKQYEAGLDYLNRAIEIAPKEAVGYRWRAEVHSMQERYDAAILDVNSALALDPDNAEYYAFRGRVRWCLKQHDERAFRDFDQAIRLDSKCFYAFGYRAEAHFYCGHFREALDDCESVLQLRPDEADVLALQAALWSTAPQAEFRDGAKAVTAAMRACELTEWKECWNLRVLGMAYAESGDFAAAATWETAAAQLAPDDEEFQTGSKSLLQLYKAGKPYRETKFLARKPGKEFRDRDAAP